MDNTAWRGTCTRSILVLGFLYLIQDARRNPDLHAPHKFRELVRRECAHTFGSMYCSAL
jgi:hypothetical protein